MPRAFVSAVYNTHVPDNGTKGQRNLNEEVEVGSDQEKAQSEKDSHSKNRGGKKTNNKVLIP